jgi:hypothetical protein
LFGFFLGALLAARVVVFRTVLGRALRMLGLAHVWHLFL